MRLPGQQTVDRVPRTVFVLSHASKTAGLEAPEVVRFPQVALNLQKNDPQENIEGVGGNLEGVPGRSHSMPLRGANKRGIRPWSEEMSLAPKGGFGASASI